MNIILRKLEFCYSDIHKTSHMQIHANHDRVCMEECFSKINEITNRVVSILHSNMHFVYDTYQCQIFNMTVPNPNCKW